MQRILVVVVLAALALAACSKQPAEITANDQVPADQRTASASEGAGGGASEGAGGGGDATWVAVDIDFESAPETLPAGETTITLTNNGAAPHNVTIDDEVIVEAAPGSTEEGTIALEPGTYEYICSVPGHEQSMNGSITVE